MEQRNCYSFIWFGNRRIANGPIESRNNIIKLIIHNAAGYNNFDHLRLLLLYCIYKKMSILDIESTHF